ncbi:hypothetical protein BpHYR1_043383 [Brachionus plicatilis]|uniref:Uncharacterized protein n=1 Tax=Brachionus plicatilis TaxID=10195 RepID=A0A3M7QVN6_BRAPC|nr:hypothetical protein BpHYR1_043383 [Brachionus plicatilis]
MIFHIPDTDANIILILNVCLSESMLDKDCYFSSNKFMILAVSVLTNLPVYLYNQTYLHEKCLLLMIINKFSFSLLNQEILIFRNSKIIKSIFDHATKSLFCLAFFVSVSDLIKISNNHRNDKVNQSALHLTCLTTVSIEVYSEVLKSLNCWSFLNSTLPMPAKRDVDFEQFGSDFVKTKSNIGKYGYVEKGGQDQALV